MNNRNRYIIATCIMLAFLMLLGWPYINAQLAQVFAPTSDVVAVPSNAGGGQMDKQEIGAPNTLRIASLGIGAPIQYVQEKNEQVYQAALRHGVVHYPGTALPGELGNVYIFGHSSDYVWASGEYKAVFAVLPQIEQGAEIEVANGEGRVFTYGVIETKVVGPRDLSVLDQFNNERKLLTLQTSYPLGTALQRYIVVAELLDNAE